MSTITSRHPHLPHKPFIVAALGAVLVISAGIVAWQLTRGDSATITRPATVATSTEAMPVSDQEMYQRWRQAPVRSPEVVLIIVASEEAAAVERAALEADSGFLAEVNAPPRQFEVVVVTTPKEEQLLYQLAADLRVDDGFTVTVIDLRPS